MNLPVDPLLLIVAGAALFMTARTWLFASPSALAAAPQAPAAVEGQSQRSPMPQRRSHGVVIQVDHHDPAIIRSALENAEHLIKYYEDKGEEVAIEFVALGQGLHMLRSDSSLVKAHLDTLSSRRKNVTFSGCGIAIDAQSRQERKAITLVHQAVVAKAGVGRITELQERGWTYLRP